MTSFRFVAILVLGVLLTPAMAEDEILCKKGTLQFSCPVEYPVCCIRSNGAVAACCPTNGQCDLEDGTCTIMLNKTAHDGKGTHEDGIFMTVPTAAGLLSFGILALLAAVALSAFCGYKCFAFRVMRRLRREEEERSRLEGDDANSDEDGDETTNLLKQVEEEECDDEMLCVVCYTLPKNTAMMDCGHVCCCHKCAKKLDKCPICRLDVKSFVKIAGKISLRTQPMSPATVEDAPPVARDDENEEEQPAATSTSTAVAIDVETNDAQSAVAQPEEPTSSNEEPLAPLPEASVNQSPEAENDQSAPTAE